jgi:cell division protein FtsW (lipid II flippase)
VKQTVFLGVAAVLDAIGAFLATIRHLHWAYVVFAAAIAMAIIAVVFTYRTEYRTKRGKQELGHILRELSACELAAYDGQGGADYDALMQRIKAIKTKISEAARKLDSSIEDRFLAVNVYDVQLDEATRMHFISRAQGDFWTAYQLIRGWRACVVGLLQELRR